ncbi:MAG: OB-fold domain-containing protein [Myxococcota bacterium]|jgi:uncharacterized OB-fold protein
MPLLEEFAAIHPDLHTRDFWEACGRHELQFQRCGACGTFRSPPMTGCRHCGSTEVEWVVVSGRGRVFSHTTVVHPALPEIAGDVPYNVVVVEFDDAPGARLISNVLDTPPEDVHVGMELDLVWDEPRPGVVLPRFRAAGKGA